MTISARATKYVASNTMTSHEWQPSVFLGGDIVEKINKIKQTRGAGSACLPQVQISRRPLLWADLVEALWLKIFPLR